MQVEHVLASQSRLGEGPIWHHEEKTLYWVDIHRKRVERYQPASGRHDRFAFHSAITALGLRARGGFVVATDKGFAFWDGHSTELEFIQDPEQDRPHNRFNDGAVDPGGRFWAGTMYEGPETEELAEGRLYRLDADRTVRLMETGLTISNGVGWSPDKKTMYFTDTLRRVIYAYDFDVATGTIENRRPFVRTPEELGFPDGMAVDSEGFIWSAHWGGWRIRRYDPQGKVEREILLPVECPTSCTFGGEDLSELYITSAWTALSAESRSEQPQAGDLFRIKVDVKGQPETLFAG